MVEAIFLLPLLWWKHPIQSRNCQFLLRLVEEVPNLWLGQVKQTALLQCEHKPGGGQDMKIISESQYPHFCPVYTSDRSILYQMTLGQVPIRWHGIKRVPPYRETQVTITVQVARRYSLSLHFVDSGKMMSGSRESQFFWQRPPLQKI